MPKQTNFEEDIVRLEQINKLLESGSLSLEESIKLFEEGSKLSRTCYKKLETAKQKVEKISMDNVEG